MHPILIDFGFFQLPTYGLLMVTALVSAMLLAIRQGKVEGLDSGRLLDFSTWLIVVALVGAKVLMILTDWRSYWENPGEIVSLATLRAGGVFYGGFISAVIFAWWYVRVYGLPLWKVFDAYAPGIALGLGIGRLGCFAAGCDYGKPTHSFLGVVFTSPIANLVSGTPLGVRIHPTQLYESLTCVAIFALLMRLYRRKTFDGQIFASYLGMYAVARFGIEFLRGDPDRGFVFGGALSTSQFIAILAIGISAILYWRLRGQRAEPAAADVALPSAKRARG
ncbi:MAG: prolipoprotein diacylglyceryl transferase [Acidobacteria bacterium]|nr:prolipoprotein diacylglyceryl transferase [Acidobacteriota bacterium]